MKMDSDYEIQITDLSFFRSRVHLLSASWCEWLDIRWYGRWYLFCPSMCFVSIKN